MGSWDTRRCRPAREPCTRPDHRAIAIARSLRCNALIAEALAAGEALLATVGSPLTHEWLAERTGVPLGYLRWRFPALDDVRRELGSASRPGTSY